MSIFFELTEITPFKARFTYTLLSKKQALEEIEKAMDDCETIEIQKVYK